MKEIRFDPAFLEEAVFLELRRRAASGEEALQRRFSAEWAALYEREDSVEEREGNFRRLAERTFQALGLSDLFSRRRAEFPDIASRIELTLVRRVFGRAEERVELHLPEAGAGRLTMESAGTLFIGLQVSRCLDPEMLTAFLRHEMVHVSDMVHPAFEYDPHADLGGGSEGEDNRIRDRFRLLWDVWTHGRCRRRGWPPLAAEPLLRREWEGAFASMDPANREALFHRLIKGERWTQGALLAIAREGCPAQRVGLAEGSVP